MDGIDTNMLLVGHSGRTGMGRMMTMAYMLLKSLLRMMAS